MSRIENIKYLRQIGASLQLQDDVANKVGGYDSALFVPTVEFILKLQNSYLSTQQQQEQGITATQMPNTFDPEKFKGVDLELAAEIVADDDMPKKQRKQAVAYINNIADQRDKFLEQNPDFDAEKNLIPTKKKDKKHKQQQEQSKEHKKSTLLSAIVDSVKSMNDKLRQTAEIANLQSQQARANQGQQQNQQAQKSVGQLAKEYAKKNVMSLFQTKKAILENDPSLLAPHKRPKEEIVDKKPNKEEFLKKLKSDKLVQAMLQQQEKLGHRVTNDDLMEAAKAAKHQLAQSGNTSKDMIISKMIDNIVKGAAEKKDAAKQNVPNIDDAVAKLSNIGVSSITSSSQGIDNKKALADQQQAIADQQRQRG